MATENMGTLIMIKIAKENRGMIKMSKEKRSVMIKIKMTKEHRGMMIKINTIKENKIKMIKGIRGITTMIKIKTIKENRSATTMIMSKMIKENRSMTVKEASRDLSEPGMQRRSPTMWWRKRDGNIIRIFFWGEIQGFVLIKVDISWRGTGHHTVQNTLHLFYLGTYLVIIVYDTVATVPES